MKNLILLICLVSPILGFSQAWAPFQFDQAILYATYDSTGPIFRGNVLTTVKFDTAVHAGSSFEYYSRRNLIDSNYIKKFRIPTEPGFVMLYGKRVIKKQNIYVLEPLFFGLDTIKYYPNAQIGRELIRVGSIGCTMSYKGVRLIDGVVDSIKLCKVEIDYDSFEVVVSKSFGFVSVPNFFHLVKPRFFESNLSYLGSIRTYVRLGKAESILGSAVFLPKKLKFRKGDIIQKVTEGSAYATQSFFDTITTVVDSVWQDTCLLRIFGKRLESFYNYNLQPPAYQTEVHNLFSRRKSSIYANLSRTDTVYSYFPGTLIDSRFQNVLITPDGLLFYGLGLTDCHHCNADASFFGNLFPIFYDFGGGTIWNVWSKTETVYFQRGDTIFGNLFTPNFTSLPARNSQNKLYIPFPNPSSDKLFISGLPDGDVNIIIYDSHGRRRIDQKVKPGEGVSIRELPPGIYFYQLFIGSSPEGRHGSFQKN